MPRPAAENVIIESAGSFCVKISESGLYAKLTEASVKVVFFPHVNQAS